MNLKRAERVPPEQHPKPNFEPCRESIVLTDYFKGKKAGDEIFWDALQRETGIVMDLAHKQGARGRSLARAAVARAGHAQGHYSLRGVGFILVDAETAMPQSERRRLRIKRQAKRSGKEITAALSRFSEQLKTGDKASLTYRLGLLGAIQCSLAVQAIESKGDKQNVQQPMLPGK